MPTNATVSSDINSNFYSLLVSPPLPNLSDPTAVYHLPISHSNPISTASPYPHQTKFSMKPPATYPKQPAPPQSHHSRIQSPYDGFLAYYLPDPPSLPSSPQDVSTSPPLPDIHSKKHLQRAQSTPNFSRTTVLKKITSVLKASKVLNQVVGFAPPEPFACPPEMPADLEERFMAGMQEYGVEGNAGGLRRRAGEDASTEMARSVSMSEMLGWTVLEGIREEMDSSIQPTTSYLNVESSDTELEQDDSELLGHDKYAHFGSTTTLAESLPSRPGSSSAAVGSVLSLPDLQPRRSNVALTDRPVNNVNLLRPADGYRSLLRTTSLSNLRQPHHIPDQSRQPRSLYHNNIQDDDKENPSTARRAATVPVPLFPSPRVERDLSWDFIQTDTGSIAPRGFAPGGYAPATTAQQFVLSNIEFFTEQQQLPSLPQITIQAPSPRKMPSSRKRRAPSQDHSSLQRTRPRPAADTTGLPTLSADQEMLWKMHFPGNTSALLTILLTWSLIMQRLQAQLPNPYLFSINPAFPYPIDPPVCRKLVSVAFYDMSTPSDKELRFIGPGDVAQLNYYETDVFTYNVDVNAPIANNKLNPTKSAFRMPLKPRTNPTSSHHGDSIGQGRWAYILIQGHRTPNDENEAQPHLMIAWPIHAITSRSECIHTIYPDLPSPPQPRPTRAHNNHPSPNNGGGGGVINSSTTTKPPIPRFSSLQNLHTAFKFSLRYHANLRAASVSSSSSSAAGLPPSATNETPKIIESLEQDTEALTLRREVLNIEKAGKVPLVEGYRVDLGKWKAWLDACARGEGKVVVWWGL